MLLVVGALVVGIVAALVVWSVVRRGDGPTPAPPSSPSASHSLPLPPVNPSDPPSSDSPNDPDSTRTPAVPAGDSTRTPPWDSTRTEPRTGMAPVVPIGETVEFFTDDSGIGLITVQAIEWLPVTGYRQPDPGYAFLAVQVHFEAISGDLRYSPTAAYIRDPDGGRYDFLYNSSYDDYPQFDVSTLKQGETMTGWVLFEVPKSDLIFTYETYTEQATRVQVEGGGPVAAEPPPIVLNASFEEDSTYGGKGTVDVLGAAWFTTDASERPQAGMEFLAVKVRVSADPMSTYASNNSQFWVDDAAGNRSGSNYLTSYLYRPQLRYQEVAGGDMVSGWVYFEVPRGEVTFVVKDSRNGELGVVTIPG